MTVQLDVEKRLQGDAQDLDRDFPGADKLERLILARVDARPRVGQQRSWRGQLIGALAVLALAVGVAVTTVYLRTHESAVPKPSPTPTPQPVSTEGPLVSARFLSAQAAWVQSTRDLMSTDDGGQHWRVQLRLGADQSFDSVTFVDGAHVAAVVVANTQESAQKTIPRQLELYTTVDAGNHWRVTPFRSVAPAPAGSLVFDHAFFLNAHEGWRLAQRYLSSDVVQAIVLYHTFDSGAHWTALAGVDPSQPQVLSHGLQLDPRPQGGYFIDSNHGFLGVFNQQEVANLYVTEDGGRNWRLTQLPPPPGGWAALFNPKPGGGAGACCPGISTHVDPSDIAMFGREGVLNPWGNLVYSTVDGGLTWTNPRTLPPGLGVVFLDVNHWLGMSSACCTTTGDALFQTSDAGKTWQRLASTPPPGTSFGQLIYAGPGVIWARASIATLICVPQGPTGCATTVRPGPSPSVPAACDRAGQKASPSGCDLLIRSNDGGAHWTIVLGLPWQQPPI